VLQYAKLPLMKRCPHGRVSHHWQQVRPGTTPSVGAFDSTFFKNTSVVQCITKKGRQDLLSLRRVSRLVEDLAKAEVDAVHHGGAGEDRREDERHDADHGEAAVDELSLLQISEPKDLGFRV